MTTTPAPEGGATNPPVTVPVHPSLFGTDAGSCRKCTDFTWGVARDCARQNGAENEDQAGAWADEYVISGSVSPYYCDEHHPRNRRGADLPVPEGGATNPPVVSTGSRRLAVMGCEELPDHAAAWFLLGYLEAELRARRRITVAGWNRAVAEAVLNAAHGGAL